ncbi:MAG: hypothetical protein H0U57_01020 [Tatlockia sp.]|nr:hypothetical protein [Tatlockia sp.]
MVAFTQLCEKVNISFYNDTITLYPNTHAVHYQNNTFEVDYEELIPFLNELHQEEKSIKGVQSKDSDHPLYHKQDDFNEKLTHYHVKFPEPINQKKLEQILDLALKHDLLTQLEREKTLDAYQVVSQNLTLRPAQSQPVSETNAEIKPEIMPEIKPEIKVESKAKQSQTLSEPVSWNFSLKDLQHRISKLRVTSKDEENFLTGLNKIVSQGVELEKTAKVASFPQEHDALKNMSNTLFQAFVNGRNNKIDSNEFKISCGTAIGSARGLLDKNWKTELAEAFNKIINSIFALSKPENDLGFFKRKELISNIENVKSVAEEIKFQPK